jgi:iron complex transport system substrate-binding protein
LKLYLKILLFAITALTACNPGSGGGKITTPGEVNSKAERFSIENDGDVTRLTVINPWQGSSGIKLTYFLVRRGAEVPDGIDTSMIIYVPVRNIICMSATHAVMIEALGEDKTITGISGADLIYSESLNARIRQGFVKDVGYESSLNNELILNLKPDLIMMYGIGGESAGYVSKIKELGVPIMYNADYLEKDPVGKAEWIKVFGALYSRENLADSIFNSELSEYEDLCNYINRNVKDRPRVMLGLPYRDTWYISPGNSYINKLISDAGGKYIWDDKISEISMPFGLENVYMRAVNSDFWLNTGTATRLDEIAETDYRLAELPVFKNGKVYNNNLKVTSAGGNDYWETGTIHPSLILKDMAKIFHPELFPDYKLFFYRKLN